MSDSGEETGRGRPRAAVDSGSAASRRVYSPADSADGKTRPGRSTGERMTEVTRILEAIGQGDRRAAAQLLPLVYDELRRMAAANLAREKPGQTLQATALVHEAYLRLVGARSASDGWQNRRHFFAAAA